MKNRFRFLGIAALVLIGIVGCEKDLYSDALYKNTSEAIIKRISMNDVLLSNNKLLISEVSRVKLKNDKKASNNKLIYNPLHEFYIDDTNGVSINIDGKLSYMFAIRRNTPTDKNEAILFLKTNSNQYSSYITKNDLTDAQQDQLANKQAIDLSDNNFEIENIDFSSVGSECDYYAVDRVLYQTDGSVIITWVWVACKGDGAPSQSDGPSGNTTAPATTPPSTTASTTNPVTPSNPIPIQTNSPTGPINPSNSLTGAGGGRDPIKTTVILDNRPKKPCEKVQKLFTNLPNLPVNLISLKNKTDDIVEHGNMKLTNSNIVQTVATGTDGKVSYPLLGNGVKFQFIAHTHNSPANSTYSIFSWDDLEGIAELLRKNAMDEFTFTFFVLTADGTNYGLTIDNPILFSEFMALGGGLDDNYSVESGLKRGATLDKYYDVGRTSNKPLISENGTSNVNDKINFLKMIKENGMGLGLLEADNDSLDSFSEVTLDENNNLVKKPCN